MSKIIEFPVMNRLGNALESHQSIYYIKFEDLLMTRLYLLTNGGTEMEIKLINQLIISNVNENNVFPLVTHKVNKFYRETVLPLFLSLRKEEHHQWDLL